MVRLKMRFHSANYFHCFQLLMHLINNDTREFMIQLFLLFRGLLLKLRFWWPKCADLNTPRDQLKLKRNLNASTVTIFKTALVVHSPTSFFLSTDRILHEFRLT